MTTAAAEGGGGISSCDFCERSGALVYCRADSARLCLSCDRHVHAANAVSSRHPRSLLCDACGSAPSSVLVCGSPGFSSRLLCQNCDFDDVHGQGDGGRARERRPVEPYYGCPTAVEMLALLGVSAESEKSLLLAGGGSDGWLDGCGDGGGAEESSLLLGDEGWVWETSPILSLDDILVPISPCHGFQAVGVPPPPKDRNAACGKHKDEILRQLRQMVKSDVSVASDLGLLEAEIAFQSRQELELGDMISNVKSDDPLVSVPCPQVKVLHKHFFDIDSVPAFSSEHQFETYMEESKVFLDGSMDAPGSVSDAGSFHLMSREDLPSVPPKSGHRLSGLDRDTVLSRYKEKRKTRRFDKQIRYESRKVRADGRMRIKGRFAKVIQHAES